MHRDDDLVGFGGRRVEAGPARVGDALGVAEHAPHLLRAVRSKGRQHQHQGIQGFAQHADGLHPLHAAERPRTACRRTVHGPLAECIQLVDQLHERRHRGVEVHPLFDVDRDPPNRFVRLAPHGALRPGAIITTRRDARSPNRPGPMIHETPHPHEKPKASFQTAVAPLHFLFGRGDEHHVEPERIRPVFLEHLVRIDDVALRFGHDVAVFEHHALREQPLERLVEVEQPHVAQHAGEEARVEQMQNRVLDSPAVKVHRHPVGGVNGIERQVGIPRIAKAQEVPGRVDKRVHRVGLTPRRSPTRGTRRPNELRHLREGRIASASECRHLGQRHRQLVERDPDDAVFVAIDDGDRRAPITLARDAPILQAILHFARPNPPASCVGDHPRHHVRGFLAGVFGGVDQTSIIGRRGLDRSRGTCLMDGLRGGPDAALRM